MPRSITLCLAGEGGEAGAGWKSRQQWRQKSVARRCKILESFGDVRALNGEQLHVLEQALHEHRNHVAHAGKESASAITPILFLGLSRQAAALTGILIRIIHGFARNLHQLGATRA
jgi:hypothetical protein